MHQGLEVTGDGPPAEEFDGMATMLLENARRDLQLLFAQHVDSNHMVSLPHHLYVHLTIRVFIRNNTCYRLTNAIKEAPMLFMGAEYLDYIGDTGEQTGILFGKSRLA